MAVQSVAIKICFGTRKVPVSELEAIPDYKNLEKPNDSCLQGKQVRQTQPGLVDDEGNDKSDHWVLEDAFSVQTGKNKLATDLWLEEHLSEIKNIAKSFTLIYDGEASVSFTN